MDINLINKLALGLSAKQLPYNRINFTDTTQPVAIQPPKPKIPEYLSAEYSIDTESYDLFPTAGKDSFLHTITKALYPQYNHLQWADKTKLISKLREHLLYKLGTIRGLDPSVKQLDESLIKKGLNTANMVTTEAKFYTAAFFDINLIVLDARELDMFFSGTVYKPYKATIFVYESDDGIYYLLAPAPAPAPQSESGCVSAVFNLSESKLLKSLYPQLPTENKYYKESPPKSVSELKQLMKFSLNELQDLAVKQGVSTKKVSGTTGKLVNCKKEELAQALVNHMSSDKLI